MWKDEEAQEKQKLAHDGYCGHFDFGYLKMQRMSAPKKKIDIGSNIGVSL